MKYSKSLVSAIFALGLLSGTSASATPLYFNVPSSALADGSTFHNGQGGVPFGFDPDKPRPTALYQPGPTGFGSSSYWSNPGEAYTAFRMSPKDIFGVSGVTMSELASVSYWTKNTEAGNSGFSDWQLKIYTEGDATHWYGKRFMFDRPSNLTTGWTPSSTATTLGVKWIANKMNGHYWLKPSSSTDTLLGLGSSYGGEKIMFMDIVASCGSSGCLPVKSYLDGVNVALRNGDSATMNLTVPEPGNLALMLLGMVGLGVGMRRQRSP